MQWKSWRKYWLIIITISLWSVNAVWAAPGAQDTPCEETYTVQAGDWLSTIAEKYYGDPLAYTVIVNATNLAAQTDNQYTPITNPAVIEPAQRLCLPAAEEAQELLDQVVPPQASGPVVPDGKMLLIVGNRTFENLPTTLTISGGEFGGGQEFTIDAGSEMRLEVDPGTYQATWSSPQGSVSRDFKAVAGVVAIVWIVPEKNQIFAESKQVGPTDEATIDDTELGLVDTPSVQSTETSYKPPAGKALFVAGNRSLEQIHSVLTLSGGQFGGGEEFIINPGQETFIVVEPGQYRAVWTGTEGFALGTEFQVVAGEVAVVWVVPEEERGFLQYPGQPGQQLK